MNCMSQSKPSPHTPNPSSVTEARLPRTPRKSIIEARAVISSKHDLAGFTKGVFSGVAIETRSIQVPSDDRRKVRRTKTHVMYKNPSSSLCSS